MPSWRRESSSRGRGLRAGGLQADGPQPTRVPPPSVTHCPLESISQAGPGQNRRPAFSGAPLRWGSSPRRSWYCWPARASFSSPALYFLEVPLLQVSTLGGQGRRALARASTEPRRCRSSLSGSREDRARCARAPARTQKYRAPAETAGWRGADLSPWPLPVPKRHVSLAPSPPLSVRADAHTDADAVGDAFGATYLAVGSGTHGVEEAQPRCHLRGILQFEGAFGVLGPLHTARAILRIEYTAH